MFQRPRLLGAVALVMSGALMSGCGFGTSPAAQVGAVKPAQALSAVASGSAVASPAAPPRLVTPTAAAYDAPVHLAVEHGRITAVTVQTTDGIGLSGAVDADGAGWTSATPPRPGARYDVAVTAAGSDGASHDRTGQFVVAAVPKGKRLTLTVRPGDGAVVGVGAPIIVTFDQLVTDRAAVEQALVVAATHQVAGAWHWVSDREVHFRPEHYWPSGTTVEVRLGLSGVRAGKALWGGRDYTSRFTVGASHISVVDGTKHTMTVTVNGRRTATWPVSLGRPEFATRTGTFIVLSKESVRRMTSCNANITCDTSNPNWYDLPVRWTVRLTWSGTFVHAAPWSVSSQGRANVSHGCINLSAQRGKAFFAMSRYGDVVTVVNTRRTAADLVASADPGMVDWNSPWSTYVAGSALDREVQTLPLAG